MKKLLITLLFVCANIKCAIDTGNLVTLTTSLATLNNIKINLKQNMPYSSLWRSIIKNDFKPVDANNLLQNFTLDCENNINENMAIPKHKPNKTTLRIATYNVHALSDPNRKLNFKKIIEVIKNINADIIILQEMPQYNKHKDTIRQVNTLLEKLDYTYKHNNLFIPCFYTKSIGMCGNIILIKNHVEYKILNKTIFEVDKHNKKIRAFIGISVKPTPKIDFNIYGTHLDVYDETGKTSTLEILELIEIINAQNKPSIIAADCNAVRKSDYLYKVNDYTAWDLLNTVNKIRTGIQVPTETLNNLIKNGFQDCFTKNRQQPPKFTVWTGTAVDFLWLNKNWNLPIVGTYVYYSDASDHLPIIMDIKID